MIVDPITNRELEILGLISDGLTNPEIAARLSLSVETIKWYNKQSFSKLGVANRAEAVAAASERGLLVGKAQQNQAVSHLPWQNLPDKLSTFVGRDREIREVIDLMTIARLVTLTGPGGVGKTRLAVRAAAAAASRFLHGVTFVSLASTMDHELVPDAIAHRLGVVEKPDRPLVASLRTFLGDKQLLLVLDNFEHVIEAAPLLADLLAAAPRTKILVTSREILRLSGEHEYRVPPLRVPENSSDISPSDLLAIESVDLFVQRAKSTRRAFTLTEQNAQDVAAICRRLDGLPLAIELAAARIKLFSAQQLLARLETRLGMLANGPRDLPTRQRTLQDTIEWSHNLLQIDEQRLLARMAVFVDGRTIEAVETIAGFGLTIDVLDGLESLLDKSLLYQEEGPNGEPRFYMLEIIQEFALERLADSGEMPETRNRHLDYFLALAKVLAPGFTGRNQLLLLEQTKAEMGNYRAAFEWALTTAQMDAAASLIVSLDYYWSYRGGLLEGYRFSRCVYDRIKEVSPQVRTPFLLTAGRLADYSGHRTQSNLAINRGIELAYLQEDPRSLAGLLAMRALLTWEASESPEVYPEAVGYGEEAVFIFRELEDKPGLAQALNSLGEVLRGGGDLEQAREVYREGLEICFETGEICRQGMLMANLAFVAYRLEDYEKAQEYALDYLRQRHENGMHTWHSCGPAVLAGPWCKLGSAEKAARLLGATQAMMEMMKLSYQPTDQREIELYTADVKAELGEADFETYYAEGEEMTMEEVYAYVLEGQKHA